MVGMGTNPYNIITAQKHPIQMFAKEVLLLTLLYNKGIS